MVARRVDALGHDVLINLGTNLAAAAVGVTTAGSIAGTTAAGAAPTVAIASTQVCNDRRGTFTLTPVTGGGAQAAGIVATVRFSTSYPFIPNVNVQLVNTTPTPDVPILAGAVATVDGFDIVVAAALTTANAYQVVYSVET